uniref:Cytochrome P450 n=1 Tax=Setaria viridis TaxID=4556 RepID=A0A4U6UY56_SETVI|nr:hypothetical protein SEVIR_4G040901v2 [Setaria viridis]
MRGLAWFIEFFVHIQMVQTGGGMGMAVAAALAVALLPWLWAALVHLVCRPYAVARAFARQGIRGPPYRFFVGNAGEATAMLEAASGEAARDRSSHDIVPRVMPHLRAWTSLYGKVFLSWSGSTPALCVGSYAMARRVLSDKAGLYGKKDPGPAILALLGMGLIFAEGEDWVRHRRVVHPAFARNKLKAMAGVVAACAGEVIRSWEAAAAVGGEVTVEVGQQFMELTADVISRTAFGSSYRQGKEVFLAQRELQLMAFASNRVRVPGMQWARPRPTCAGGGSRGRCVARLWPSSTSACLPPRRAPATTAPTCSASCSRRTPARAVRAS